MCTIFDNMSHVLDDACSLFVSVMSVVCDVQSRALPSYNWGHRWSPCGRLRGTTCSGEGLEFGPILDEFQQTIICDICCVEARRSPYLYKQNVTSEMDVIPLSPSPTFTLPPLRSSLEKKYRAFFGGHRQTAEGRLTMQVRLFFWTKRRNRKIFRNCCTLHRYTSSLEVFQMRSLHVSCTVAGLIEKKSTQFFKGQDQF